MIGEQDAGNVGRFDTALAQEVTEYESMVRRSVSAGQLLSGIEVARDGIARFGPTRTLQQQLALALAQTGALSASKELLTRLTEESARNEETLSLLGRVHKELWRRAVDPVDGAEAVRQACGFYREAFSLYENSYPGINLAFTLAAAGEMDEAEAVARKVAQICRKEIDRTEGKVDGWLLATLGEALIHLGDFAEAETCYRQASTMFEGRWRDLASMRRQARETLRFRKEHERATPESWTDFESIRRRALSWFRGPEPGDEWLERCFDVPSIVVFSGHLLDEPNRPIPRFPASAESRVRDAVRQQLLQAKAGFGYSSLAAGADIIFCECLLEMEAKVNLVLPCSVEAFKRQSVNYAGPDWEKRFHHVLANSDSVVVANPTGFSTQSAAPIELVYASRIATGLARLQAQALNLDLRALAVWDGVDHRRPGGTASQIRDWKEQGLVPEIVSAGVPAGPAPEVVEPPRAPSAVEIKHEIKAMLFANVVNFQQITEPQMPAFVEHFKGAIGRLLREARVPPVVAESWAGVHFFVYDEVEDAARVALALRDLAKQTSWAQHGLPKDLGVRIVLHAAPVYAFVDPTLGRLTCAGSYVNRAARIEPVTPRDQVYATQEFAALCGTRRTSNIGFEYLGYLRTTTLFEDAALYRLDLVR